MKNHIVALNNAKQVATWIYNSRTEDEVSYALELLYEMSNNAPLWYTKKTIPKKSGGTRILNVPKSELKKVQKCIVRGILNNIPTADCAKAYKKGVSIDEAMQAHVGHRMLLKLDIKDFFDKITFKRVLDDVFMRYYPKQVAVLLAALCCCRGHLPQGAPTSPAISNIVMKSFDNEMLRLCEMNNIIYTRYCDDLIFSGDFDAGDVIRAVKNELSKMGMKLNREKIKVIVQGQRQVALGVCVNEKMQVPAPYRKSIRQEIYYCKKYGVEEHLLKKQDARFVKRTDRGVCIDTQGYIEHIKGKISFVLQINHQDVKMQEYMNYLSDK